MKEYRDLNETVLTNGDIIDINQTVNGVNTFVILFRDNKLCVKYWMNNKPGQDYEYDKEDLLKEIYDGSVEWVIVDNIGSYNLTPEDLYSIKETVAQTTRSKYRGHNIIFTSNGWIFESSKQLVENNKNIKCGHCSKQSTKDGHDSCLGTLPGLMNVCCGHGIIKETYIQFLDGFCIRGANARIIIGVLKAAKNG